VRIIAGTHKCPGAWPSGMAFSDKSLQVFNVL